MAFFSRYLRTRERSGTVVVFHLLHPDPTYCTSAEWAAFTDNPQDNPSLADRLRERRLLVAAAEEDDSEWQRATDGLRRKLARPSILYLMLAQGCNFACSYCPIPGLSAKHGTTLLSIEDARAGLLLWSDHLRDAGPSDAEDYVIFYGGEPLLNKPVFLAMLRELRAMQKSGEWPSQKTRLMLATNGSLVDDEILRACREHDVLAAVGIDTPAAADNRTRRYADGTNAFEDILKSIRRFVGNGVRTVVSASILPNAIADIVPLALFLKGLGVEKFGLNFLKGSALSGVDVAGYARAASAAVMDAARLAALKGYEYQWEKKAGAFRSRDFFPVDCTCYGNQLVVQPDGQASHCPFVHARLGHVAELRGRGFRIAATGIVDEWRERFPVLSSKDSLEDATALTGPGCAWGALDLSGDLRQPDEPLDIFAKEAFDELIWSEWKP